MPREYLAQTLLAAAFLVMAAAPGAQAQREDGESRRRTPPPATGPAEIIFYSDTGLRGTSVTMTGDQQSFASLRFNDKARSVEVKGGVWQLCSDSGLRGQCEYVDRTVRNLGELGLSGNISSAQLTSHDRSPRGYDITFFNNTDYRGTFQGFDEGEASLSKVRFNDAATSVMINHGSWLVCEHADYRGRCELLDGSVRDLSELGMNDTITSFRRYDERREGPWRRPVVAEPLYPPAGGGAEGIEGEQSVFFPAPTFRGARISNRDGAATRFCQDNGFYDAAYKAPGPVLSDVLCR